MGKENMVIFSNILFRVNIFFVEDFVRRNVIIYVFMDFVRSK